MPTDEVIAVEGEVRLQEDVDAEELAKMIDLDSTLTEQNTAMVGQLAIIGQGLTRDVLAQIQLETLVDFVFDGELMRKQFETACSLRLNQHLKAQLGKLIEGLEVPSE